MKVYKVLVELEFEMYMDEEDLEGTTPENYAQGKVEEWDYWVDERIASAQSEPELSCSVAYDLKEVSFLREEEDA